MGSGRGKIKLFHRGDRAVVIIDVATTQTRVLKKSLAAFLRKEASSVRPSYQSFDVRIWTSVMPDKRGAHDVDNIAKAVLDALTGVFWRDDRQVVRLKSERFQGEANRIAVRVVPLDRALDAVPLDENLLDH